MKFLLFLTGLLLMSSTSAKTAEPYSVYTLKGACEIFSIGDEDLTSICAGEVMQVVYTDSRMDLSIWTDHPSGRFFVFSGTFGRRGDDLVQTVDQITDGKDGSGNNNVDLKATGECLLTGNPSTSRAHYKCEATDKAGTTYRFGFLTDGTPPENMLD